MVAGVPASVDVVTDESGDYCTIAGVCAVLRVTDSQARRLAKDLRSVTPESHPRLFAQLITRRGKPNRLLYPLSAVRALADARDPSGGAPGDEAEEDVERIRLKELEQRLQELTGERDRLGRENNRHRKLAADLAASLQRYLSE